ncbi:RING finger protein 37 [Chelonus insularis]|uniref:RING finger protein 37 n=1 Tax=Chelonus insularis TaxID=460826 RepID=UPI00158B0207|nr:RING finger protein 37 [Chelonus insularis]
MVLVNLCHHLLQTEIKCDKPSNDDHDINNLLLDSDKGFLVYSCIKPPINIDFNFISNIKLSHIKIWPSVGAQKSKSFRIFVKTNTENSTIVGNSSYYQISSGDLSITDSGIIFCRSESTNELKINDDFIVRYMNGPQKIKNNVKSLRLTITRTENSVAALKRIEIWGHIPYNKLPESWFQFHKRLVQSDIPSQDALTCKLKNGIQDKDIPNKTLTEIPEEYLDPITFTIMIQPIILPCGKIIDFHTLEKFGENEALWGRPLSDPFTGIPFSDNYKPIFADTIKSQIDKFITENSHLHEFQKIPRVLGPHGVNNAAVQQYRNEVLTLPHLYKNTNKKHSSASNPASSSRNYSEESKLKHKMPINANKLSSLFRERKKQVIFRKINVKSILENNLVTINNHKETSTQVDNMNNNSSNKDIDHK